MIVCIQFNLELKLCSVTILIKIGASLLFWWLHLELIAQATFGSPDGASSPPPKAILEVRVYAKFFCCAKLFILGNNSEINDLGLPDHGLVGTGGWCVVHLLQIASPHSSIVLSDRYHHQVHLNNFMPDRMN